MPGDFLCVLELHAHQNILDFVVIIYSTAIIKFHSALSLSLTEIIMFKYILINSTCLQKK